MSEKEQLLGGWEQAVREDVKSGFHSFGPECVSRLLDSLETEMRKVERARVSLNASIKSLGWHAKGPEGDRFYYCEFCKAKHEDSELTEHSRYCPLTYMKQALKELEE